MRLLDCSVVICTHDAGRFPLLERSVESVLQQSGAAREVIVVVDHNPSLLERATCRWPRLIVVPNTGAPGLSAARNAGVAQARGRVVAFLDDDAVAALDWLENLVEDYDEPAVAGAGGSVLPFWVEGRPSWFPPEFDWVVGCTYRGGPAMRTPVRNVIGANMSFRREVFDEIGLFRAGIGRLRSIPLGCEETELSLRLQRRWPDRTILFDPAAKVVHQVPRERARLRYFLARCFGEGVSKSRVVRLAGPGAGLSTERDYVLHVLPAGVVAAIVEAVRTRRLTPLQRASAIVAGAAATAVGFASGLLRSRGAGSAT